MGKSCCENKAAELAALRQRQGRVLKIVLAINATMFLVEFAAGILSKSTSLLADSLDMFGDSVVYAFSLYVLGMSVRWRASAALLKGLIMTAFGIGVLGEAIYKILADSMPVSATMGSVGLLALAANAACLVLLLRHKADDINMRSTWLCSRNDIVANLGVLAAAGGVALTGTKWPDIGVGMMIAVLFLSSAVSVLRESWAEFSPHADGVA